jgi:hypothetical protein
MPRSSLSTAFPLGKSLVDVCPASNSQKIQNQLFTDGSHFQGSPTRRPIKMIAGLGWGLDAWFRYDWADEVQRLVRKPVEGLYNLDILRADYVSEEGRLFTHTLVKIDFMMALGWASIFSTNRYAFILGPRANRVCSGDRAINLAQYDRNKITSWTCRFQEAGALQISGRM